MIINYVTKSFLGRIMSRQANHMIYVSTFHPLHLNFRNQISHISSFITLNDVNLIVTLLINLFKIR